MSAALLDNELSSIKLAVTNKTTADGIAGDIIQQIGGVSFDFLLIFYSSEYGSIPFLKPLKDHFNDTPLYGCSTAGEITPNGFSEGNIVVVGFCDHEFGHRATFIPNLKDFSIGEGQPLVWETVRDFQNSRSQHKPNAIALMLVDGLSYKEEQLVSAINSGLMDIPLIGGSAADGLNFEETSIINNGTIERNAATLLLIESRPALTIFKSDSFVPTPIKFVVTKADPENRIVHELNAMPAAQAYSQAIGLNESELDHLTFASHPLCVCFGGECYTRSKQTHNGCEAKVR